METSTKILIAGATGFLGQKLGKMLVELGHEIVTLSRQPPSFQSRLSFPCDWIQYDGKNIDPHQLEGLYAVINLAGANVAEKRWSASRKQLLRSSRLDVSEALVQGILQCRQKPAVYIQASAIGIYESGFLKELCQDWEKIPSKLPPQVRVLLPRIGVVLGWGGGAYEQLSKIYASGFGAVLGSGRQWLNGVHVNDVLRYFKEALQSKEWQGPFNLVAPENITFAEAHRLLCQFYPSSPNLRAPSSAIKIIMGEASKLLLEGSRIGADPTHDSTFSFQYFSFPEILDQLEKTRHHPGLLHFEQEQWLPHDLETLWKFFSDEKNLEAMTPSWLNFKVTHKSTPETGLGTEFSYRLRLHGIPILWKSRIEAWDPMNSFTDIQWKGPYHTWDHTHRFTPLGSGVCMRDEVDYKISLFPASSVAIPFVTKNVEAIFEHRARLLPSLLAS